jgi:hypothetical protein
LRASATTSGLRSDGGGSRSIPSPDQVASRPSSRVRRSSVAGALAGGQRPESIEQRRAERVHRSQHLRRRAEVAAEGDHLGPRLAGARALGAEHLEVRVPKPVDRLVLVADDEQARGGAAKRLDEVDLDRVRVLELVDQDVIEALAPFAPRGRRPQQLEGAQLEVGEVERRAGGLRVLVAAPERLEGGLERGARVAGGVELSGPQGGLLRVVAGAVHRADRLAERRQPRLGHPLASQAGMRGEDHLGESARAVGGERPPERLGLAPGEVGEGRGDGGIT